MIKVEDAQKNKELFDIFIAENKNLVNSVISKKFRFVLNTLDYDDYFQAGCIGLIKATRHYNSSFGTQFSTYAVPMIIGEIQRYRRDFESNKITISRPIRDLGNKIYYLRGIGIDETEICNSLGISPKKFKETLSIVRPIASFSDCIFLNNDGSEQTIGDAIASDTNLEQDILDKVDLSEKLTILKQHVRPKDYRLLELRAARKTQSEISKIVGMSQVEVSRRLKLVKKIYKKIDECFQNGTDPETVLAC